MMEPHMTDRPEAADASGVIQADREASVDIHNVILHDWFTQHMIDGMEDECYVIQAFKNHRLHSVAAATAAKDAEIARLKSIAAEALELAQDWVDNYVGTRDHEWGTAAVENLRAALSEAREAE